MTARDDVKTAEAIRLYVDEQLTVREVAERMGLGSHSLVFRRLKRAGVEMRPAHNPRYPPDHHDVVHVQSLRRQGLTIKHIMQMTGFSRGRVFKYRRRAREAA